MMTLILVMFHISHYSVSGITSVMLGSSGPSTTTETETVAKYEIMDGAPVKGESIPIRLFLAGNSSLPHPPGFFMFILTQSAVTYRLFCFLLGYDLTPTMRDVNKKFSVRYFLNLVLVDEEDRRYFKQQVLYALMLHFWFLTHCFLCTTDWLWYIDSLDCFL